MYRRAKSAAGFLPGEQRGWIANTRLAFFERKTYMLVYTHMYTNIYEHFRDSTQTFFL